MEDVPMLFLSILSLSAGCVGVALGPWNGGKKDAAPIEAPEIGARFAALLAGLVGGVAAIGLGFALFIDTVLALFWR